MSKRQPSSGSRSSRIPGTPGQEQAEGARHQRGAVRAPGHERSGERRPEVGETGGVGSGVPAEIGDRVVKMSGEIGEIDAARSGAPAATDDRVARMSEHLGHRAADGSYDQNGLTSEGFQEQGPSEQLTPEKRPARVAGRLLEGRVLNEQYRQQGATDTESLTVSEDRVPRSVATAER